MIKLKRRKKHSKGAFMNINFVKTKSKLMKLKIRNINCIQKKRNYQFRERNF